LVIETISWRQEAAGIIFSNVAHGGRLELCHLIQLRIAPVKWMRIHARVCVIGDPRKPGVTTGCEYALNVVKKRLIPVTISVSRLPHIRSNNDWNEYGEVENRKSVRLSCLSTHARHHPQ
jgi:hypothetical protein